MATKIMLLVVGCVLLVGCTVDKVRDLVPAQQILGSTLIITMIVPEVKTVAEVGEALPIPPDEYRTIIRPNSYVAADGLGTLLLNPDGQLLIVTHDHWTTTDSDLGIVRFRTGHGQMLAEVEMWQFKRLIKHNDGGTIVLWAPEEIAAQLDPKQLKSLGRSMGDRQVTVGDVVNLVYRQREGESGVAVMQVEVKSVDQKKGLPVLWLSNPEGLPVIAGDSGGGIWFDGVLVANTWATIMMVNTQTGHDRPANTSIAALTNKAWAR